MNHKKYFEMAKVHCALTSGEALKMLRELQTLAKMN